MRPVIISTLDEGQEEARLVQKRTAIKKTLARGRLTLELYESFWCPAMSARSAAPFAGTTLAPLVTSRTAQTKPPKRALDMSDLPLAQWKDEHAQNIAEYAIIVAVIVILVVGAIHYFWSAINHMGQ
jgi:hypothetical protein